MEISISQSEDMAINAILIYIYTKLGIQGTRDGENHKMKTLKTVSREFP